MIEQVSVGARAGTGRVANLARAATGAKGPVDIFTRSQGGGSSGPGRCARAPDLASEPAADLAQGSRSTLTRVSFLTPVPLLTTTDMLATFLTTTDMRREHRHADDHGQAALTSTPAAVRGPGRGPSVEP